MLLDTKHIICFRDVVELDVTNRSVEKVKFDILFWLLFFESSFFELRKCDRDYGGWTNYCLYRVRLRVHIKLYTVATMAGVYVDRRPRRRY